MDPHHIAALKTLTEASRLRIVGLLAAGTPRSAPEIAAALSLPMRTVVRQVGLLHALGLVSLDPRGEAPVYALRIDQLAALGAALDRLERASAGVAPAGPGSDGQDRAVEEARVLRAFFVEGRLASIPAHEKKRQVVLRYLAESVFVPDRDYPEKEVNQLLALRHPDVAALRRYLVDSGYLERAAGIYRVRPRDAWPVAQPVEAVAASSGGPAASAAR